MSCRHVIFDLDGTLVDSAPGILMAFSAVLTAYNIVPRCAMDTSLIGPPLAATLSRLTGIDREDDLKPLIADFKRCYDSKGLAVTPAYTGIGKLLEDLVGSGCSLHIATNKRIAPTRFLVERHGWARHFDSIHALDFYQPPLADKKTLLARLLADHGLATSSCVYVGDRHDDGAAADDNQLPFIAVAWGYGTFDRAAMPTHWSIAASPAALEELLLG